ncbi:hypothetical protein PJF56_04830 [Roseofilum sp. BLCC_M91]|uniref:Uncharacterized protein n=1 Tax=Roseofilum halophilum BLCC-M91 TaxID=3022259 RepID=A0ABT7BG77_9CYAN|nr:hypothetical protein [Roseofilum halophilum]MDJ1178183.1 hypothetical protein [Roseofilum halophilum BLCC-M91]
MVFPLPITHYPLPREALYAFEPTEIYQLYLIEVIFEPLDSCSAST